MPLPSDFTQGGDAQAVSRIAAEVYGGYRQMFDAHGWSAPGEKLMTSAPALIVKQYGSIRAFEAAHQGRETNIWDRGYSVLLTSFWGWSPETWGTVGFTSPGRRNTVVRETSDPFIVVVYVTKHAGDASPDIRSKITGFYLVSHIEGHRNQFIAPEHRLQNPEKWQYSLKALRAFSFLPEYRLDIDEFDPTIKRRAQAVAQHAEAVSPDGILRLRSIPFVEVPVFGGPRVVGEMIHVPETLHHKVKAGPQNRSGYFVDGEPIDTEKELYALVLEGDTTAFLGEPADNRRIFKIGLSISPSLRLAAFRKSLPKGAFNWKLHCSTRADGDRPYPSFDAAVAGEDAMKAELGRNGNWLGGEFYAATEAQLESAWLLGRKEASNYSSVIADNND